MARPVTAPGNDAQTRLHEAFWEALAALPYAQMTVTRVCQAAGLNRNSFYYHYSSIAELAEDALAAAFPVEMPALIIATGSLLAPEITANLDSPDYLRSFRRMCLVAGPHGGPELLAYLRSFIIETWIDNFDLSHADLTASERFVLHFAFGGLTEVAGHWGDLSGEPSPRFLVHNRAAQAFISELIATLEAAQSRVEQSPGHKNGVR